MSADPKRRRPTTHWETCPKCEKVGRKGSMAAHIKRCGVDYAPTFWSRLNKTETCWLWTGSIDIFGYGHFAILRKDKRAHRYAWEITNGPIPSGMDVLHSCDVRHCANPAHLRLGTHKENMDDKRRSGSNGIKLTAEKVREIKALLGRKTNKEIGQLYGVSGGIISAIKLGRIWSHVQ